MLLFLQFGFGCSAHADDCHTAGELRQPFLEFFAVIIAGGFVNFHADLLDASLDSIGITGTAHNGGAVLVCHNLVRLTKIGNRGGFQLASHFFGDHGCAGEDSDVLQHGFAAIAKTGGFDSQRRPHAADAVEDEGRQGFAVNIFGDDHKFALAHLEQFFQDGDDIGSGGNLAVVDQDVGLVEDNFHPVGIGDEVGRNVAAVKFHAFHVFGFKFQTLGFFHRDDAVLANLVHYLGNQVADGFVLGRDRRNSGNVRLGGDFN